VRKIVVALMGTVSGLIMLFSYHTSLGGGGTVALAPIGTGTSTTTGSSGATTDGSGSGSSSSTGSGGSSSSGSGSSGSGAATVTGDTAQTQWGPVQVQITVSSGTITDVTAVQYPSGNGRDQEINSYALPVLAQEAVAAQSANIDHVSGATVTSDGYVQSLQSALDKANL
jgi:major membrane immunogen (membrane-anchored lipoprotein)